jgi:hypothetical protein
VAWLAIEFLRHDSGAIGVHMVCLSYVFHSAMGCFGLDMALFVFQVDLSVWVRAYIRVSLGEAY